ADHEGPLAPQVVGDPATQEQQAAEGKRVGGDDPLPVGVGGAEGCLRRRQRNADDGRVERDHQLRHRDERERDPPPPIRLRRNPRLFSGCGSHAATSRRRTRLDAPTITAPTSTTPAAIGRLGLTVMSKSTPTAIPIRTSHVTIAVWRFMRPRITLMPVYAPIAAMRTSVVMPTTTHPAQPHCTAIM